MLYSKHIVITDDTKFVYISERRPLVSVLEVESICRDEGLCQVAYKQQEACGSLDLQDLLEVSIEVKSEDLTEDEFAAHILSGKCQLVDSNRSFGDVQRVITNVYRVSNREESGPFYYLFEAECGQESDVDSLGYVDADNPSEVVFEDAWKDCAYQLRRYFKMAGVMMERGVFHITQLCLHDYEQSLKQKELFLA